MFKRIIIASETSPYALNVVQCLQGMRKLGAEECLLLQGMLPQNRTVASPSAVTSEENLRQQQEILTKQGYKVETRTVTGNFGKEVNRIAAEEDFSLIVVGIPEFAMKGEGYYSAVAQEAIHRSGKPALLVRISDTPDVVPDCTAEGYSIINHILFPTDFSENAGMAFEYVKKMAAGGARKVTLAHVQDQVRISSSLAYQDESFNILNNPEVTAESEIVPPESVGKSDVLNAPKVTAESVILPPDTGGKSSDVLNAPKAAAELERFNTIDTGRLEGMKKELQDAGAAEVDISLLYGSPSVTILRMISEQKIPLVVMGSQGRGFVKELFLGSVSNNIVRHATASVLLIPAKR
jgi:nucleotide-binding universal stress UspA family protein